MARVHLDRRVCQAYGNCVLEAADYFDLDEDENLGVVLKDVVVPTDEGRVLAAARSCPVQAIEMSEAGN
jgi:ferredoxin